MSPCDQMVTVPLSFMEWVDRKITPIQNSALYPVALGTRQGNLPAMGRGMESGGPADVIGSRAAGFLDGSI
jgi:hypothetical protein